MSYLTNSYYNYYSYYKYLDKKIQECLTKKKLNEFFKINCHTNSDVQFVMKYGLLIRLHLNYGGVGLEIKRNLM